MINDPEINSQGSLIYQLLVLAWARCHRYSESFFAVASGR